MRPASPLLTSMPDIRVLDAHVYIGGHHLPPLKVHHQLTLAGIEGRTLVARPENLDLRWGDVRSSKVADRWRHPRYLTRRGNLHSQKCPHPWLPPIPATSLRHGAVNRSHCFSPCVDLSSKYDLSLVADGDECLTQGLRKRIGLNSDAGRVSRVHPRVFARLLSILTPPCNASLKVSSREMSGVSILGNRRMLPTGRLATRGEVRHVCCRQVSPRPCWRPSAGGK
jgi:hypothetical protein